MTESTGAGNPASYKQIDPPHKSLEGAQWWLVYAILVANKSAEQTARKIRNLLELLPIRFGLPFEQIEEAVKKHTLFDYLCTVKTGQYTRINKALTAIAAIHPNDPREWTLEMLEGVPGIGPKTSRWYFLLVHPDAKVAALDTHVLKFLKDQGVQDVPQSTPPKGPGYARLEQLFLNYAERFGLSPRDLDFMVWSVYKNKGRILF